MSSIENVDNDENCFAMEEYGANFEMMFTKIHQIDKRNYELEMRTMELELRIVQLEDELESQNKKYSILIGNICEYAKSSSIKSQSTFVGFIDMVYNHIFSLGLFNENPRALNIDVRDHISI
jgi:hypothetical protein